MIKNLFIPEVVNGYYPLTHRILGISITSHTVSAVQLKLHGKNRIIEKTWNEWLAQSNEISYQERVQTVVSAIIKTAHYDQIRSSLTSSQIVFKELTLPFLEREQLELVVRYEVEPLLPFALNQAVIDFIITSQDATAKTSTLMIGAAPNAVIQEHLALYGAIKPDFITIDMFDLYSLYSVTPALVDASSTALAMIGMQATTIEYCIGTQLKFIRVLPQGLVNFAKKLSAAKGISATQALEEIIRFGMVNTEDPTYTQAMSEILRQFAHDLQFTFESFATQHQIRTKNLQVTLLGIGSTIPDIAQALASQLPYACGVLDTQKIVIDGALSTEKNIPITVELIPALGAALPTNVSQDINFKKGIFATAQSYALLQYLGVSAALFLSIITLLLYHTYQQTNMLLSVKKSLSNEIITSLKEQNLIEDDVVNLAAALEAAEEKITEEEEIWFALSSQTGSPMLKNLQTLFAAIDREGTKLDLERIEITENNMSIKGEVPGYPNLKILERELEKSDLFEVVPSLQELKFDETLSLKKKNGGN